MQKHFLKADKCHTQQWKNTPPFVQVFVLGLKNRFLDWRKRNKKWAECFCWTIQKAHDVPFWLKSEPAIRFLRKGFALWGMRIWLCLALAACHVPDGFGSTGDAHLDGCEGFLQPRWRGMGGLRFAGWRPWRRSQIASQSPSRRSRSCLRSCSSFRWPTTFCHTSRACGIGLQAMPTNSTSQRRWKLGCLGGHRPLAGTTFSESTKRGKGYVIGNLHYTREETQAFKRDRSRRRQRVHGHARKYESSLASAVLRCYGWSSRGGQRTNQRATISATSQDLRPTRGSIHGLWNLRTLWSETIASIKIQSPRHDPTGIRDERNPRSCKLRYVESLISGLQGGHDHVGHCECGEPDGLRGDGRAFSYDIPISVAFGGHSGGQCERRAFDAIEDEATIIAGSWRDTTNELEPKEAMGSPLQDAHGGREILARASSHPGHCMDGVRSKRHSQDAIREDVPQLPEGWGGGHNAPIRKEWEEQFTREKEEAEEKRGDGRAQLPEGKRWRIPRKRRKVERKRKGRKRPTAVLRMERQHRELCRTTWSGMQSTHEERSQVYEMQVTWTSCFRMPYEEAMRWIGTMWTRSPERKKESVRGEGSSGADGSKGSTKQEGEGAAKQSMHDQKEEDYRLRKADRAESQEGQSVRVHPPLLRAKRSTGWCFQRTSRRKDQSEGHCSGQGEDGWRPGERPSIPRPSNYGRIRTRGRLPCWISVFNVQQAEMEKSTKHARTCQEQTAPIWSPREQCETAERVRHGDGAGGKIHEDGKDGDGIKGGQDQTLRHVRKSATIRWRTTSIGLGVTRVGGVPAGREGSSDRLEHLHLPATFEDWREKSQTSEAGGIAIRAERVQWPEMSMRWRSQTRPNHWRCEIKSKCRVPQTHVQAVCHVGSAALGEDGKGGILCDEDGKVEEGHRRRERKMWEEKEKRSWRRRSGAPQEVEADAGTISKLGGRPKQKTWTGEGDYGKEGCHWTRNLRGRNEESGSGGERHPNVAEHRRQSTSSLGELCEVKPQSNSGGRGLWDLEVWVRQEGTGWMESKTEDGGRSKKPAYGKKAWEYTL